MGRRRRSAPKNRRRGPGHNEANRRTKESRTRAKMLDAGRENHFRFDSEQILEESGMEPEDWRPLLQTIWARGSRDSVDDAKAWLRERQDEGELDGDTAKKLTQIISQYATYR